MQKYFRSEMNEKEISSFMKIFMERIVSAYYVNLDDLSWKVFINPDDTSKKYQPTGSYLDAVGLYIESEVALDDQKTMYEIVKPEFIREHIKDGNTYTYLLKDISRGDDRYYRYQAVQGEDENHAVIAFIDATEEVSRQVELRDAKDKIKANNIIDILSSEYNAVYYCNEDTHDYDILFQQGFVKNELMQLKAMCPKYEDGFNFYIKMFVHPDDRENMARELSNVPNLLQKRKSVRIEFRRLYGDKYLYTELYCVKIGEAEDKLHEFVAGFIENDEIYRSKIEQQKQLEYIIAERTAELENRNKTLNRISEDIIELLGNITEARDVESGEHIRRVKGFTNILARQVMNDFPEYGLRPDIIELMTSASALHDIGKITIPDSILLKPGKLTNDEFEVMKTHCNKGCEMLRHAPEDWSPAYLKISMDICKYHHERYDGRGYPDGLSGEEIPVSAQIVAVADCFDALISKRVYKDEYDWETAYNMILNGECGAFSENIMSAFEACKSDIFRHASDSTSKYDSEMPAGLSNSSLSHIRILAVDDNEISAELTKEVLEAEGAVVTLASSGAEAIEAFKKSTEGSLDVILMDVFMPDMDGMETSKEIRKLERSDAATIPIIALTSLTNEEDINRCISAGMDSFLTKPISIQMLDRVLYECLENNIEPLNVAISQAEKNAEARIDSILQQEIFLTGITPDYDFLCYINEKNNTISGIRSSDAFHRAFEGTNPRLPVNKRLDRMFRNIIPNKDFPKFIDDSSRSRVISFLKESDYYVFYVPLVLDGCEKLYQIRFSKDKDYPGSYLLRLQSVSNEAKAEYRAKSLLSVLANSFLIFDVIDFEEDRFTRYQNYDQDSQGIVLTGSYSEESNAYVMNDIHEEDRDRMYAYFNPTSIRNLLRTHKTVSTRYRSTRTGTDRYIELQFVNTGEDDEARYAILMLSDVDAIVRKEIEDNRTLASTKMMLHEAEKAAMRDGLTGVKNFQAYASHISNLSEQIRSGVNIEFAAVICDVNNLKSINDNYGHTTGDVYIKNCCRVICDVFKRSPIYRMGGDEFCAILSGRDYSKRKELFNELRSRIVELSKIENMESGKASFASGMATYDKGADETVTDVIKRADRQMYINKAEMKQNSIEL